MLPNPDQPQVVLNNPHVAGALQPIPEDVQKRMDDWSKIFLGCERWHNTYGVLSIVASSLAASQILPSQVTSGLAVAAAVLTSLVTFLGHGKKASAYKAAWRVADGACFNYRRNPTPDMRNALYDAVQEGERIIAQTDK
jgi:hypothetical protein